jgi:HK97 family phage portal protein
MENRENLLTRLFGRRPFRRRQPEKIDAPPFALASAEQARWTLPAGAMYSKQAELYARLTWVQAAVNLISASVASAPMGIEKRVGEGTEEIINHPFELLLDNPNPLLVDFELMEWTANWLALTGNAYWWLNAPNPTTPPTEIWLLPPYRLKPIPDGRMYISSYEYEDMGYRSTLPVEEIVHFRRFHPNNDFVGLSPIEALATVAVGDMAAQKWNTRFFDKDNANMPYILAFADMIEQSSWDNIKAEFKKFGGAKRGVPMLRGTGEGGVSAITLGMPQKDMEFLAGREWNRDEISLMYGVHPGLYDKNATEANATVARANFADYTLWPLMQRIAKTIGKHILPRYGDGLIASFDDPRVVDRQLELQQRQTWSGYRTIDELRESDNLEPIGDERGELLSVELAAMARRGEIGAEEEESQPVPPQLIEQEDEELEKPAMPSEETEPEPTPASPNGAKTQPDYTEDLLRWRGKAVRLMSEKGTGVCAFDSETIPAPIQNTIAGELAGAKDKQAVKDTFAGPIATARDELERVTALPPTAAQRDMTAAIFDAAAALRDENTIQAQAIQAGGPIPVKRGAGDVHLHVKADPPTKQELPPVTIVDAFPSPVVNVEVNVPEQDPPIVNVSTPPATVDVTVPVPEVNVDVAAPASPDDGGELVLVVERDKDGKISRIRRRRQFR